MQRITTGGLQVAEVLYKLVTTEVIAGTGIEAEVFWSALERCIDEFGPRNQLLLKQRDVLQQQIDDWHLAQSGQAHNLSLIHI